jgi:hypothetical protein
LTYKTSHNLDPARLAAHGTVATRSWLLPLVAEEDCSVLKGGTAINLFVRDLPAVQWKLKNLHQMPSEKYKAAYNRLQQVLMPAIRTGEGGKP